MFNYARALLQQRDKDLTLRSRNKAYPHSTCRKASFILPASLPLLADSINKARLKIFSQHSRIGPERMGLRTGPGVRKSEPEKEERRMPDYIMKVTFWRAIRVPALSDGARDHFLSLNWHHSGERRSRSFRASPYLFSTLLIKLSCSRPTALMPPD